MMTNSEYYIKGLSEGRSDQYVEKRCSFVIAIGFAKHICKMKATKFNISIK